MKDPVQKIINNRLKSALLFGSALLSLSLGFLNFAGAQTVPEFIVTWKALNYVPADYIGKTLPSASSMMEAGMDVIDKGKITDLSRSIITWYVNNAIIKSGIGLKNVKFNIDSAQSQILRVVVADYNGAEISDSFIIPIQRNEVILSAKTPSNNLFRNRIRISATSHIMEARPFFFNVTDLNSMRFSWKIGDQTVSGTAENPNFLSLNLKSDGAPQETELSVSAGVSSLSNQLELGNRTLNFIVK